MSPDERALISRMGAHALHSRHDSKAITQPARAAFMARFENEVDPDRILETIPKNQLDTFVRLIGLDHESRITRVIRIGLRSDGVVLSVCEPGILSFDLVQVVERPSELRKLAHGA